MAFGQWVGFLGVAIALYILWEIRHIVLLIFAAVVLARALNGVARWLQGFRISRGIAVFLTILLTFLVMVLFVGLIVPPFLGEFQELVRLLPKGLNQLQDWFNALWSGIPNWFPQAPEIPMISEFFSGLQLSTAEYQWLFAFFQNTLALMLRILLVLVLALMLLSNPQAYRQAFLQIFPSFYRRRADYILSECDTILGSWLAGILFNSLFIGCLSGLGLWLLGVRFVLAHALLAGLLNFIPNIGPTMSVVFPMAIALIDSPWKALAVLGLYVVIQQLESYWLTPVVMARQVSLLPALTLAVQIFFATVFGPLGLLLALPLAVIAKVWIQETLIKDVLDRWQGQDTKDMVLLPGSEGSPPDPLPSPNIPTWSQDD